MILPRDDYEFETLNSSRLAPQVSIASIMELAPTVIATVMEPPDRQGHGAAPRVGVRRIAKSGSSRISH